MTRSAILPGQIRAVTGGYGLMRVLRYDPRTDAAEMDGHGHPQTTGHWFPASRLGEPVGPEVVLHEHAEARARRVDCNNPDCWCREWVKP